MHMGEYSHILVALDLTDESRQVAQRAQVLAKAYDSKLSCVHAIEPLSLIHI